jgi:hypothetical protein
MRAKHDTSTLNESDDVGQANVDRIPQTPVQWHQASCPSSPNSTEFEGNDMPLADLINVNFDIVSPEPFGM